jgi:CelD/BcsL family acetyltransferase involved in cellulose biosynthesis
MRKVMTLLTAFVLLCVLAIGQTRTITGKGRNHKSKVVSFASVAVKVTNRRVTADAEGNFRSVAFTNDVLVISSTAQSLSGRVSGLAVLNVNNSVDPAVKITLRGYRSMTGNNDALIALDGVPHPGS